jgi:hypothetical protein
VFSPTEISRLLATLAAKLDERGIVATITVAGGAAMGYVYDARPSTRDVDALLQPKDAVLEAAAEVADAEGLPNAWLNDKFAMFWPHHGEPDLSHIERHGTVTIQYAGPRVMLAMKMLASVRGRRDADDLAHLIEPAGVVSVEEAIEIFEDFYRDHDIPPQALAVINATLQARK